MKQIKQFFFGRWESHFKVFLQIYLWLVHIFNKCNTIHESRIRKLVSECIKWFKGWLNIKEFIKCWLKEHEILIMELFVSNHLLLLEVFWVSYTKEKFFNPFFKEAVVSMCICFTPVNSCLFLLFLNINPLMPGGNKKVTHT